MIIESLDFKDFRNYASLHLDFDPGTNVFFGDNAQGKTNILEGICLCATSRSHRGSRDREMIRFSAEEAHLRMMIRKGGVPGRIDMHLRKGKSRGIAVNGVPIRKISELFGLVNVVVFSPEDLGIVKNGPADRRRFVNMELCQLDPVYVHSLIQYNRVLQQRNQLLKEISFSPELLDTLDAWDSQLVRFGSAIIRSRREFVRELNGILGDIHAGLTGGRENLVLSYEPDTEEDEFAGCLVRNLEEEKRQRTTLSGPHRDDIGFSVDGINLRRFGSQGQQRTAALSLKLAEIEIVRRKTKDSPILLLDDVLSELDAGRQENLLGILRGTQTLITCTGLDDFISHAFHIDRMFRVAAGTAVLAGKKEEPDR